MSREGTDWLDVLKTLVSYRLIDPGSEWRLHREWYLRSATEQQLQEMREATSPVAYLVGTPRGRLNKLEKQFLELPWAKVKGSDELQSLYRCQDKLLGHKRDQSGRLSPAVAKTPFPTGWRIALEIRAEAPAHVLQSAKDRFDLRQDTGSVAEVKNLW